MDIVPRDSCYVPIPQQPYCCGPANLSMVMLRHGLPLLPQELIGYHLGLVIPTSRKNEFWNPRHAEKPVVASGFGTQIQNTEQYGMQKALDALNIPLIFTYIPASSLSDANDFHDRLEKIVSENQDVLLCLNWGALTDQPEKNWGHILAVDQIKPETIRLIDTDIGPKWRIFPVTKALEAVLSHGDSNYGGLWVFRKQERNK